MAAWFAEADKDADGRLTRAEFRADADAFFPRLDTDNDGLISMAEVAVYERDIAPEITGLNGPGMRGRGERPGAGAPEGDRGHGGGGHSGGGRGGGGRAGGGHGRGGGGEANAEPRAGAHARLGDEPQGAAMFSLINEAHPIRGADADFSMSVSQAEWRAATDRRFALLDSDRDGVVTLADLPETPTQRMARARPPSR